MNCVLPWERFKCALENEASLLHMSTFLCREGFCILDPHHRCREPPRQRDFKDPWEFHGGVGVRVDKCGRTSVLYPTKSYSRKIHWNDGPKLVMAIHFSESALSRTSIGYNHQKHCHCSSRAGDIILIERYMIPQLQGYTSVNGEEMGQDLICSLFYHMRGKCFKSLYLFTPSVQ